MEMLGLIVDDKPGVMQRISGVFTRKKFNIQTIVVGQCELPGHSRMVLSLSDRAQAEAAVKLLEKLEEVHEVKLLNGDAHYECIIIDENGQTRRESGDKARIDALANGPTAKKCLKIVYALW